MNAFTVARELLGDLDLTPEQLAQLRALDHEYQTRLYTLLHRPGKERRLEPTEAETRELRGFLESGILQLLTPPQRAALEVQRHASPPRGTSSPQEG